MTPGKISEASCSAQCTPLVTKTSVRKILDLLKDNSEKDWRFSLIANRVKNERFKAYYAQISLINERQGQNEKNNKIKEK